MYSQRDEEKHILEFWGDKKDGSLLDVGAYDGKTFSNTRQLILNGWSAVLVEPSPSILPALIERYKDNPKVQICEAAVGFDDAVKTFQDSGGDAVSSFDPDHVELWKTKGQTNFKPVDVNVISWSTLFMWFGTDFDFINLDAEGWSLDLLEALPLELLKNLKMLIVEFDHQERRVMKAVAEHEFKLLHQTAENLILVR